MKKLLFILILVCSIQGFGQIKGYWRLDGNSNDASGNGFNGTDSNIIYSQANGILNGGAGFNGSSTSNIYVAHNANLNLEAIDCTISLWIRRNASANTGYILYKGNYGSTISYWLVRVGSGGTIDSHFSYGNDSRADLYYGSLVVPVGIWTHIVVTRQISTRTTKVYINSKLDPATTQKYGFAPISANTLKLNIGRHETNTVQNYTGSIDELIIDTYTWSPAQVKNEYSRVKGFF